MKLWDELKELIDSFDEKERNKFEKQLINYPPKIQKILSIVLENNIEEFQQIKKNNRTNVVSNRMQRSIETIYNFLIDSFPRIETKAIRLIRIHRVLFFKGLYDQARNCLAEATIHCLKYQLWTSLNDINLCIDQIKRNGTTHPTIFNNKFLFHIAELSIEALTEENDFNKLFEEVYEQVFDRAKKKKIVELAKKYRSHPLMKRQYFISYRSQARQFNIHRMLDLMICDYKNYHKRSEKIYNVYKGSDLLKEVHFYGLLQGAVGVCDGYVQMNKLKKYLSFRDQVKKIVIPNQRLKAYMIGPMQRVDLQYYCKCNSSFESISEDLTKIENSILNSKLELSLQTKTVHPLLLCFIFIKYQNLPKAIFWLDYYKQNREIHSNDRKDIHRVATVLRILLNYESEDIDKCTSDLNNAVRNITQYGFVYESEKLTIKFFRNALKYLHDKNKTKEILQNFKREVTELSENNLFEKEYKIKYIDWARWCDWKIAYI